MSFDDVKTDPDQEFELARDTTGMVEYPMKCVLGTLIKLHSLKKLVWNWAIN